MGIKSIWIDYMYIIAVGILVVFFINDHLNHATEQGTELKLMDISLKNQETLVTNQDIIINNHEAIINNQETIINNQEKMISNQYKILGYLANSTK